MRAGANGVPDPATAQIFEADAAGPVDIQMGAGRRPLLRRPRGRDDPPDRLPRRQQHADGARHRDARPRPDAAERRVRRPRVERSGGRRAELQLGPERRRHVRRRDDRAARLHLHHARELHRPAARHRSAGGASDTVSVPITAGNPPVVTIDSPTTALTWAVGDPIPYGGSAVDGAGQPAPRVAPVVAAQHPALRAHRPDQLPHALRLARRRRQLGHDDRAQPRLPVAAAADPDRDRRERPGGVQERRRSTRRRSTSRSRATRPAPS